jgi:hypothetical protein
VKYEIWTRTGVDDVTGLAQGKSLAQAARDAGYSEKNANQGGYQALAQLRGRVPELLERHGLGEEVLIDKYLRPLLDAEETKFFNDGKKQINVAALGIRHAALRTIFESDCASKGSSTVFHPLCWLAFVVEPSEFAKGRSSKMTLLCRNCGLCSLV